MEICYNRIKSYRTHAFFSFGVACVASHIIVSICYCVRLTVGCIFLKFCYAVWQYVVHLTHITLWFKSNPTAFPLLSQKRIKYNLPFPFTYKEWSLCQAPLHRVMLPPRWAHSAPTCSIAPGSHHCKKNKWLLDHLHAFSFNFPLSNRRYHEIGHLSNEGTCGL